MLERRSAAADAQLQRATAVLQALTSAPASDPDRLRGARERVRSAVDRVEAAHDRLDAARALLRSTHDPLTGVLARGAGLEHLQHLLDRAQREGTDLTLAFVDVDGLKAVNDRHGHLAGDAVLAAVGAALTTCLRTYDVAVRFGGDEFLCGLPGLVPTQAARRFEEVLAVLARPPACSVSTGMALAFQHDDLQSLISRADLDLYERRRARSAGAPAAVVQLDAPRCRRPG